MAPRSNRDDADFRKILIAELSERTVKRPKDLKRRALRAVSVAHKTLKVEAENHTLTGRSGRMQACFSHWMIFFKAINEKDHEEK